jgi:hypothetical protein
MRVMPGSYDIELLAGHALQQRIQPRPPVTPLGATDTLGRGRDFATSVQPSRLAASWSGCSWFSTVWPFSLVETLT